MEPLQVAEKLKEKFPEEIVSVEEYRGQVSVVVKRDTLLEVCTHLHDDPELRFDYLRDLCGVDHLGRKDPRFEVVYHLFSHSHKHQLRLKAQVPESSCSIKSVTSIWNSADWNERECFDMFGIEFKGHPDLRRILLPEDWEGFPLRKDYPIKGPPPEGDWPGYKEILEKSEELKQYEWNR